MVAGDGDEPARLLPLRVFARLPILTDELVETILDENAAYRKLGTVPKNELWRSCHDNLGRVLQLLAAAHHRPQDAHDELCDAAQATGRRRAEQTMPLDDVLESFRLGGRLVWQVITQQARSDGLVDADGLLELGTRVWEVVDVISARVAVAYHTRERRLVRADEQRLAILREGLLQGWGGRARVRPPGRSAAGATGARVLCRGRLRAASEVRGADDLVVGGPPPRCGGRVGMAAAR